MLMYYSVVILFRCHHDNHERDGMREAIEKADHVMYQNKRKKKLARG